MLWLQGLVYGYNNHSLLGIMYVVYPIHQRYIYTCNEDACTPVQEYPARKGPILVGQTNTKRSDKMNLS